MQTKKRVDGKNTCLTYCVAYISKIPPKRVPFFIGSKRWLRRLERWALRYGMATDFVWYNTSRARKLEGMKKLYIAVGLSPASKAKKPDNRTLNHAVVKSGNKYVYDSNPNRGYIKGKPIYYIEFTKLRLKLKATAAKGKGTKQGQYDSSKKTRKRSRDISQTKGGRSRGKN